jgi:hypothetical protein
MPMDREVFELPLKLDQMATEDIIKGLLVSDQINPLIILFAFKALIAHSELFVPL